ncbi:hypothetical protein PM082_021680 [Marasmius tenuissimus]|nr:hypothetical protein PM082_021680 [Marasmius tenuissimus]
MYEKNLKENLNKSRNYYNFPVPNHTWSMADLFTRPRSPLRIGKPRIRSASVTDKKTHVVTYRWRGIAEEEMEGGFFTDKRSFGKLDGQLVETKGVFDKDMGVPPLHLTITTHLNILSPVFQ